MRIKLQNFLFLIGCSYIGQLLFIYTTLLFFVPCVIDEKSFLRSTALLIDMYCNMSDEIFLLCLNSFLPIAIILGVINLCSNKIAQYIYTKSTTHLPRLQWYSMFFAWVPIVNFYINDFGCFTGTTASCIVAALCYPNRNWNKRFASAFIFMMLLLLSYLCEYTSFKDF